MATISRFEDIEAWKKARQLTRDIYKVTGAGAFARDYGLRDQLRRASVSVMSNIAEGFERGGDKEFRHFLAIAKGSAGEVRSQLYVAFDAGLVQESEFHRLSILASEISRIIAHFMRYLASNGYQTNKFKEEADVEYSVTDQDYSSDQF